MTSPFRENLLAGRGALITGASSGLGAHFARVLAAHGAAVACCARRADKLDEIVSEISNAGGQALAVEMDVTDRDSIADAFETATRALGPVTALINNAGMASTDRSIDLDPETWSRVMETNLTGAWAVAQRAAKDMVAAGTPGTIVNIASVLGLRQAGGVLPYAVSKAGLVQLTKSLALEWARHKIRVNAIAPGYIATEMVMAVPKEVLDSKVIPQIPVGRLGQAEEIARCVVFLASDEAGFITGSTLSANGGQYMA